MLSSLAFLKQILIRIYKSLFQFGEISLSCSINLPFHIVLAATKYKKGSMVTQLLS